MLHPEIDFGLSFAYDTGVHWGVLSAGEGMMGDLVRIRINDQEIEIETGGSILAASMKAGIKQMHLCGGHALCTTCRIQVVEGAEHLSQMHPYERISLRFHLSFSPNVRLACQAKVLGPARVETIMPLIGMLDYKGK